MTQLVIVHAHCYQPPREDPWLEQVDAEPSAVPDHDWNARIDRECYSRLGATEVRAPDPRAAARDSDARGGLARIVNLYAWCSFNVGPTLCEWLDQASPSTFDAMRRGDDAAVRRVGHGNAIAMPYHHIILPLASRRDKITEVRWGKADFMRRFGREPEGMWLPECAVDEETLEVLALEGIRFTILAPYQVRASEDTRGLPVRWNAGGDRSIAIVPYDGGLAGEVAFGGLLQNASALARRLAPTRTDATPRCTTLATDGETFGHHHKGGDSTLAEALAAVHALGDDVDIINAATLVQRYPATLDVELFSPSSWSCAHGVERWRSDCGCKLDPSANTSQRWRRPLRNALERLATRCHEQFEREGATLFNADPWSVRDGYGDVVALEGTPLAQYARSVARDHDDAQSVQRIRELLELERAVMRTFTSCAWFFDDVARIETRQVLRYAARALELSGMAARLGPELVAGLAPAISNVQDGGTGADLYVREAVPHRDPMWSAGAGAIALFARAERADDARADGERETPDELDDVAPAEQPEAPTVHLETATMTARVGAYACQLVATAEASQPGLLTVRVQHQRDGRTATLAGRTEGAGPSLVVHLRDVTASNQMQQFTIRELPESVARELLMHTLEQNQALSASPA